MGSSQIGVESRHLAAGAIDGVCFVRFSPAPTVDEVNRAVDAILSARRDARGPITLVVVVDSTVEVPSPRVALEFLRTAPIIERAISYGVAYVPGDSIRARTLRGLVHGIGSVFRISWDLCTGVDDAIARVSARAGANASRVKDEAVRRGLLPLANE